MAAAMARVAVVRQPQHRRHRSAKSQEITTGNTAIFEFLLEAPADHRQFLPLQNLKSDASQPHATAHGCNPRAREAPVTAVPCERVRPDTSLRTPAEAPLVQPIFTIRKAPPACQQHMMCRVAQAATRRRPLSFPPPNAPATASPAPGSAAACLDEIGDDAFGHRAPRLDRGRADMRQEHGVVERDQFRRDVAARSRTRRGRRRGSFRPAQRLDQRLLVDQRAARDVDENARPAPARSRTSASTIWRVSGPPGAATIRMSQAFAISTSDG